MLIEKNTIGFIDNYFPIKYKDTSEIKKSTGIELTFDNNISIIVPNNVSVIIDEDKKVSVNELSIGDCIKYTKATPIPYGYTTDEHKCKLTGLLLNLKYDFDFAFCSNIEQVKLISELIDQIYNIKVNITINKNIELTDELRTIISNSIENIESIVSESSQNDRDSLSFGLLNIGVSKYPRAVVFTDKVNINTLVALLYSVGVDCGVVGNTKSTYIVPLKLEGVTNPCCKIVNILEREDTEFFDTQNKEYIINGINIMS